MKLAIGCDEAAYQLKKTIMEHLSDIGVEYEDYGAAEGETVLYPDIARKVAEAVAEGNMSWAFWFAELESEWLLRPIKSRGYGQQSVMTRILQREPEKAMTHRSSAWEKE